MMWFNINVMLNRAGAERFLPGEVQQGPAGESAMGCGCAAGDSELCFDFFFFPVGFFFFPFNPLYKVSG